jgi:hypothetical protein
MPRLGASPMLQLLPPPDPDGHVTMNLFEGEHTFLFAAAGHAMQSRTVVVRPTSQVELDVALARGVPVTLRLHSAGAAAPPDLELVVVDETPANFGESAHIHLGLPERRSVDLSHAGTTLFAFAPGTHRLRCSARYELEPATIQVDSAPVTVDVKWRQRPK